MKKKTATTAMMMALTLAVGMVPATEVFAAKNTKQTEQSQREITVTGKLMEITVHQLTIESAGTPIDIPRDQIVSGLPASNEIGQNVTVKYRAAKGANRNQPGALPQPSNPEKRDDRVFYPA